MVVVLWTSTPDLTIVVVHASALLVPRMWVHAVSCTMATSALLDARRPVSRRDGAPSRACRAGRAAAAWGSTPCRHKAAHHTQRAPPLDRLGASRARTGKTPARGGPLGPI